MQKSVSRSQGSKISKHVAGVGGIAGKQYSAINEETRYETVYFCNNKYRYSSDNSVFLLLFCSELTSRCSVSLSCCSAICLFL